MELTIASHTPSLTCLAKSEHHFVPPLCNVEEMACFKTSDTINNAVYKVHG